MQTLRTSTLAPPTSMVKETASVVIVSMKRPLCVYFDRLMELLSAKILAPLPPGIDYPPIEVEVVGAGAAIPRCNQVARYAVQELNKKYKHLIKSVRKMATETKAGMRVNDLVIPEADGMMDDDDQIFGMETSVRPVNTGRLES